MKYFRAMEKRTGKVVYSEVIQKVKTIKSEQVRVDSPELFEFVIQKDELKKLSEILKAYFGEPFQTQDQTLQQSVDRLTSLYGGIWGNQTLYYADRDLVCEFAMLWPWSDNCRITVKLIRHVK
ncbi:MAG: hypothetical protein NC930_04755 [Candidatus Omnitrophica bacterium]|nr:hypothetical protein [Candidatus Omnitrophota bacterium]